VRIVDATTGVVRIGITAYAQEALGDIVFVTLPEEGTVLEAGQALGEVESTKSVSDIYTPFAARVTSRNAALEATPELVNSDPYGEGWLVELTLTDASGLSGRALLDVSAYQSLLP